MYACMYVNIPKVNKYNLFADFYKAARSVHIITLSTQFVIYVCAFNPKQCSNNMIYYNSCSVK